MAVVRGQKGKGVYVPVLRCFISIWLHVQDASGAVWLLVVDCVCQKHTLSLAGVLSSDRNRAYSYYLWSSPLREIIIAIGRSWVSPGGKPEVLGSWGFSWCGKSLGGNNPVLGCVPSLLQTPRNITGICTQCDLFADTPVSPQVWSEVWWERPEKAPRESACVNSLVIAYLRVCSSLHTGGAARAQLSSATAKEASS